MLITQTTHHAADHSSRTRRHCTSFSIEVCEENVAEIHAAVVESQLPIHGRDLLHILGAEQEVALQVRPDP